MATSQQTASRENARKVAKLVAWTAAMLGLLYGYDQVNVGEAQLFFKPFFGFTTQQTETANTGVAYGTLVGVLIAGVLIDRVGRKPVTLWVAIGYGVFQLAQAAAWDFGSLFIARVLLGICVGVSIVAVPVFIAESASTARRGRMLVAYQLFCVLGQIVVFLIAIALIGATAGSESANAWNWRVLFAVAALPVLFLAPMVARMPETPRFLMMKGRDEEAVATLAVVDPDADAERVVSEIRQEIQESSSGSLKEFFSKPYLRAAIFMIVMGLLIQVTGINAFTTYGTVFGKMMGFGDMGTTVLQLIAAIISALAVLWAMRVVDNWGRKPVVMTGFAVMIVGMLSMTIAYGFGPVADHGEWSTWQKVMALGGMWLALAAFNGGVGATVWSFASESLPTRLRAYGATTLLAADLVGNILVVQWTNTLVDNTGGFTFLLFSVLALFAIGFVAKFAPETKGRDVDDVRRFWENGGSWPEGLDPSSAKGSKSA